MDNKIIVVSDAEIVIVVPEQIPGQNGTDAPGPVTLTTSSASRTYALAAGKLLESCVIYSTSDINLTISLVSGLGDIVPETPVLIGQNFVSNIGVFSRTAPVNIFFEGIAGFTTIILYIR